jgi:hypothetical protein
MSHKKNHLARAALCVAMTVLDPAAATAAIPGETPRENAA